MDRGDQPGGRDAGETRRDGGFGDEGGTRVGRPDPAESASGPSTGTNPPDALEGSILEGEESVRGMTESDRRAAASTGAGAEAAEGMHSAPGRSPKEKSGVDNARNEPASGNAPGRSGSEPLQERETEHKSGYGGQGSQPKTSSDQR